VAQLSRQRRKVHPEAISVKNIIADECYLAAQVDRGNGDTSPPGGRTR